MKRLLQRLLQRLLSAGERLGAAPGDSDDARLHRSLLVLGVAAFMLAGAVWGVLYLAFNEPLAAVFPLAYTVLAALNLAYFAASRRYAVFRFVQLASMLLLPFLLMLALGGFRPSSAVILWSMLAPMGALIFDEPQHAPRWFAAFLVLVVLGGLLEPYLRGSNNLPPPVVLALFVMNIGAVCTATFLLLYSYLRQKNTLFELLRIEQEKSEQLLLNILPREIAEILKHENRTIADYFDGASILFADMVGFTPLSARLAPAEMLELLNEVFSYFDQLVDYYGVEKIRTIGDSYMVAAGVPRPRPDHARVLAAMALDMRNYVRTDPACVARNLDFRIGINSGPVVAGVIGRKKFIYDLWGDAVNTASRMESHSEPGYIQVSRATYELIRHEFRCEPRGTVQVKGKGNMETWFVIDRLPAAGPAAHAVHPADAPRHADR